MFEICTKRNRRILNPIIDWKTEDVWEYIRERKMSYCKLYDEGWNRIGCVLCPFSKKRKKEAEKWYGIKRLYIKALDEVIRIKKERGIETKYNNGEEYLEWWISDKKKIKTDEDQYNMFDN